MAILFKPFSRYGEVTVYYQGSLPHWRQNGCTYFVTFRTADSIPASRFAELQSEVEVRTAEEKSIEPGDLANWIQRKVENELDKGHGSCELKDPRLSALVEKALRHFDREKLHLGDFVVMPNHVHALITPIGTNTLESLTGSIKSFSGRKIHEVTGGTGQYWQRNSYDRIVRDAMELRIFQDYIANNPSKAGLREGEYCFGTAECAVRSC